jgi:hypothetical protein
MGGKALRYLGGALQASARAAPRKSGRLDAAAKSGSAGVCAIGYRPPQKSSHTVEVTRIP